MAEETQESKKTVVSFVVGLLIGGLLVWAFSGPAADAPVTDTEDPATSTEEQMGDEDAATDDEGSTDATNNAQDDSATSANDDNGSGNETPAPTAELPTGDGAVSVNDQSAGDMVTLESVVFPIDEGWIAVRSYENEQLGNILGAARFSKEQGLVPESVPLLAPTTAGRQYAIVFFTENGDREFSLATDVQVDSIFGTFTAQ